MRQRGSQRGACDGRRYFCHCTGGGDSRPKLTGARCPLPAAAQPSVPAFKEVDGAGRAAATQRARSE